MIALGTELRLEVADGGEHDFSGRVTDEFGCRLYATDEAASFGVAEQSVTDISSLLAGSLLVGGEFSNRSLTFTLSLEGPSLSALAASEGALARDVGRRAVLRWVPGRDAEPMCFDVMWWSLEYRYEKHEGNSLRRTYVFTASAAPFPRAVEETLSPVMVAPAAPVSPTVVVVDACQHNSDNRWKALNSGLDLGVFVGESEWVRNAVLPSRELVTPGVRGFDVTLSRSTAGAVSLAGTPYVVARWSNSLPGGGGLFNQVPSLRLRSGSASGFPTPVYTRILNATYAETTYDTSGLGLTGFTGFEFSVLRQSPTWLRVAHIDRTDQIPAADATGHQMTRTITVEGAAPTEASLHLWTDAGTLGESLVHTSSTPNGMLSLEPFLTSTAGTAASGTVSGSLKSLSSKVQWEVPAGVFSRDSTTRELLVRVGGMTAPTLQGRVQSLMGTAAPVDPVVEHTTTHAGLEAANTQIVSLGLFTVPPRMVDGEYAAVRVEVEMVSPTGTPVLDDAWLVDVETGALTWLHPDFSGFFPHLWIESPTLDYPLPRVRVAADADLTWGVEADVKAMGRHEWTPGDVHVTTVATTATGTSLQASYYQRGHTHVAKALP